jgi:hypothetical protein
MKNPPLSSGGVSIALEQHCRGVKLVIAAKEVLSNEQE